MTFDEVKAFLDDLRVAITRDNIVLLAAGVAFFALLSLAPALVALVAVWGLFARPQDAAVAVDRFAAALPDSARATLTEQLDTVLSTSSTGLGITAVVGTLVALWSASTAIKYLFQAVASVYGAPTEGAFVRFRGFALVFTLGAMGFTVIAIWLIALLPAMLASTRLGDAARIAAGILRFPALAVTMLGALAVIYRIGSRGRASWRLVSVGAGVATIAWVGGSALFAWHAANFGNFNESYGSMAGVIILMLWFFLTALVVVFGAEIDVLVTRRAERQ